MSATQANISVGVLWFSLPVDQQKPRAPTPNPSPVGEGKPIHAVVSLPRGEGQDEGFLGIHKQYVSQSRLQV